MKIALYHPAAKRPGTQLLPLYLDHLARALEVEHRVTRVSTPSAVRRLIASERPDVLHLHQATGITLARLLLAARSGQWDRVPVALTLHDYRLIAAPRFRPIATPLNRAITRSVGLVLSPSRYVLDQHLHQGFFDRATARVLPFGLPSQSASPAADTAKSVVVSTPSPGEAQLAVLQAFLNGSVVIAIRMDGISEVVRDGVNGMLVPPGDDRAMAQVVERLRSDPVLAGRLREEAVKTARLYDMTFHAAQLVDAYTRLISDNRVGPFFRKAA
jgi:glycosyltransferase involved in cell wall biosynthesis